MEAVTTYSAGSSARFHIAACGTFAPAATKHDRPGRRTFDRLILVPVTAHASLAYAHPYETATTIFGRPVPGEELVERLKTFSWQLAFFKLARLAAIVVNTPDNAKSERVRKLTIDPLTELTFKPGCEGFRERARQNVAQRRNSMVIAHEEVILFLQHLVLMYGNEGGDAPSDRELSLWLAVANDHIGAWQRDDGANLSERERLAVEMVRISRFNSSPDLVRTIVRTVSMFGTAPPKTTLSDPAIWKQFELDAFGVPFQDYFETGPGLLAMLVPLWGLEGHQLADPVIDTPTLLAGCQLDQASVVQSLRFMIGTRDKIVSDIHKRLRPDGLPYSPTALLHTPLVEVSSTRFLVASPWTVLNQLRTGIWARYLLTAKERDNKKGADLWNSAFGYMVEGWCGRVAKEARSSPQCKGSVILPTYSGAQDEVEDVVTIEDGSATLFSVKSRLVEAKVSREALSPQTTLTWFDNFFFEQKSDAHRGGCLRLLNARIDSLRVGKFEPYGVARDLRVYPVVVTYDSLGENDLLYRWLESECRARGLLQQSNLGPLTLARAEEFEQLMARASQGRSITGLLLNRERADQYRRLDQVICEVEPPRGPDRLPFFEKDHRALMDRLSQRLFGKVV